MSSLMFIPKGGFRKGQLNILSTPSNGKKLLDKWQAKVYKVGEKK